MFEGKKDQKDIEVNLENKERHEAVKDIQRSLDKLHKVFLDMAIWSRLKGKRSMISSKMWRMRKSLLVVELTVWFLLSK